MLYSTTRTCRFIRDWRTALVQIIVRDSRVRESDPMLGMLHLNVSLRDEYTFTIGSS